MLFEEMSIDEIVAVRCEEARDEGREDERLIIAGNMLSEGIPPELICKTTGLSLEDIEKLQ